METKQEKEPLIRFTGKSDLAMKYFPKSSAHTALVHLNRWITRCHPLREDLAKLHIEGSRMFFCPREVELIAKHLGEP